ncbi:hypothetical protein BIU97_12045 [Curtobacterium sp. MCBA15_009]|uniref:hypothetical protein n=1 Tax=Curtobacterium sp. MCBA15_009 TaxID=1898737 RepID=UPI0008DD3665|nr:hypothetical protein [Curtobacterium sp. MCBA15_009]OII09267.1 hypothetical protein BIU97_12045 [Curtobacterium sp. MCBA15_009]
MGNEDDRRPLVLLLAGSGYGQQAPLLWWSRFVAEAAGCEVVAPSWVVDDAAGADPVGFVERTVDAALGGRLPDLVVAKSFGCCALPWAVQNRVPGVWLTPVLSLDAVATALAAAPDVHDAIGGSDDPLWQPQRVPGTAARLQTVDRADHALQVTGDWRRSQRLQADVFALVERRVAGLGGPRPVS